MERVALVSVPTGGYWGNARGWGWVRGWKYDNILLDVGAVIQVGPRPYLQGRHQIPSQWVLRQAKGCKCMVLYTAHCRAGRVDSRELQETWLAQRAGIGEGCEGAEVGNTLPRKGATSLPAERRGWVMVCGGGGEGLSTGCAEQGEGCRGCYCQLGS